MKTQETILCIAIATYLWPVLVPSVSLMSRWSVIRRRFAFWFSSVLLGYGFVFGPPFILFDAANVHYVVESGVRPGILFYEHAAIHYWPIAAIIGLILLAAPVLTTEAFIKIYSAAAPRG